MSMGNGRLVAAFAALTMAFLTAGCYAGEQESPAAKKPKMIALVGGTVIDGTGADPLSNAVVVIQDDRILCIRPRAEIEIPARAKMIDINGCTILPGFINTHVHAALDTGRLRQWVQEGVTTVRDLGSNADNLAVFLKDNPEAPRMARLVAAGPMITAPGGYPIAAWNARSIALEVSSPQQARLEVEGLLDRGAKVIKIALERGDLWNPQTPYPILDADTARMIVKTAHGRGTVVSVHITSRRDIELALAAGVDDLAHMVADGTLSIPQARQVVESGTYWVPTLELWHNVDSNLGATAKENLRRFVEAGGKVALGTDFAGYNAEFDLGMPMREIRWMKESGMTSMQIIVAGTSNAAHLCNLGHEIGTIEKGKIADILVVKGDPLADLEALTDIRMVMRNGVVIREER
jgi:imidazolonepropionase-like amidohydrolase